EGGLVAVGAQLVRDVVGGSIVGGATRRPRADVSRELLDVGEGTLAGERQRDSGNRHWRRGGRSGLACRRRRRRWRRGGGDSRRGRWDGGRVRRHRRRGGRARRRIRGPKRG